MITRDEILLILDAIQKIEFNGHEHNANGPDFKVCSECMHTYVQNHHPTNCIVQQAKDILQRELKEK